MYFYEAYFSFFQTLNQNLNHKPDDTQELTSIEHLFSLIVVPKRVISFTEIVYFLHELQLIADYVKDKEHLHKDLDDLQTAFCNEILVQHGQQLCQSLWLLTDSWKRCNFILCEKIRSMVQQTESLQTLTETNPPSDSVYKNQLGLLVIDYQEHFDLLRQILKAAVILQIAPPLAWYAARPELKPYESTEALLNLAFSDLKTFQQLHVNFPGFLAYKVRSHHELSIFCQLNPLNFYFLLIAPQVQQYVPDKIQYLKIVKGIFGRNKAYRIRVMQEVINTLDELVAVINFYSDYLPLIATKIINLEDDSFVYEENPCAQLIRTREDLCKFNLTNLTLLNIIRNIDRFRVMVGTSEDFVVESTRKVTAAKQRRMDCALRQNTPGFFQIAQHAHLKEPLDERLLSLGQVVNMLQFHEEVGYYSSGEISFSDDKENGHFVTEASKGYGLAIALSFRAFQVWQCFKTQDVVQQSSYATLPFEILECGAGNGMLCFKIFEVVRAMAVVYPAWAEFLNLINYTIIELSPALVERQKHTLSHLIAQKKVEVLRDDALNMTVYNKGASLHISNELMDMFPAEEIVIDENEQTQVVMAVPVLTVDAYNFLKQHHDQDIEGVEQESQSLIQLLVQKNIGFSESGYALTAQRYKSLLKIIAAKDYQGPVESFNYCKFHLPIAFFPEIQRYLANNDDILAEMIPGDSKIICPALATYSRLITDKSLVSIVIDYGDATYKLRNDTFRSFSGSSEAYKNLYLCHPGKRDITFDVDFTALVNCVRQHVPQCKMNLVFIRELLPAYFNIPDAIRAKFSMADEAEFRKTTYIAASYVAPGLAVKYPDLKASFFRCVSQAQLLNYAEQAAGHIVDLNRKKQQHSAGPPIHP